MSGAGERHPQCCQNTHDPNGVAITNTHLWMVCWQVEIIVRVTCLDGSPMCDCVFRPGSLHLGNPKKIIWQCVTVVITVLAWWHPKYLECFIIGADIWVPLRSTEELPGIRVRNLCY